MKHSRIQVHQQNPRGQCCTNCDILTLTQVVSTEWYMNTGSTNSKCSGFRDARHGVSYLCFRHCQTMFELTITDQAQNTCYHCSSCSLLALGSRLQPCAGHRKQYCVRCTVVAAQEHSQLQQDD
jgi:hypothetical protein